jgi:hypothetical protein
VSLHNGIPAEASNVVNLAIYRTNRDAIHRQRFAQTVIDQQSCNVDHLCASIDNIASLCVIIADLRCNSNIDDPRNAQSVAPLRDAADEDMASFLAAATVDALELKHSDDSTFNVNTTYAQCLIHARRIVRDPEYAHLFGGRNA